MLKQQGIERVHGCLEATSIYGHALATYLHTQGHPVSSVNPVRIKGYGQSQLRRTKNDHAAAKLIAQFCRTSNLRLGNRLKRWCWSCKRLPAAWKHWSRW